jgi:hypothetical protein
LNPALHVALARNRQQLLKMKQNAWTAQQDSTNLNLRKCIVFPVFLENINPPQARANARIARKTHFLTLLRARLAIVVKLVNVPSTLG